MEPNPAGNRRKRVRNAYRVITIVAGILVLLAGLNKLGLFDDLAGENGPLYTIAVILKAVIQYATVLVAILALRYSFILGTDWRMALPCWLFVAGALLSVADLRMPGETVEWLNPALALFGASVLAAAWVAWSPRGIAATSDRPREARAFSLVEKRQSASSEGGSMSGFFARETFRSWVLRCYRVISIAAPLIWAGYYAGERFGEGDELPIILVMATFAIAFALIPAFFIAAIGGVVLRHDWKTALPLWLYVAAALLAIDSQWIGAQKPMLFAFAGWMIVVSLVAAAWSGWTQRETK